MDGDLGVDSFHERHGPFARVARKQRDIFPLPKLDEFCGDRPLASRKVVRKHLVEEHVRKEVNHSIWALNSMYGAAQHSGPCFISLEEEIFGVGASQLQALDYVKQSVHAVGRPPEGLTCSGAFESLRAAEGYMDEPAVGSLCSFNLGKVSLPEAGWEPIPLADLWGRNGREFVEDFVTSQLLPPQEVDARLKASGVLRPYSDPLLRQRSNYVALLQKLHGANLIEFSDEEVAENISIFFVTKKNDRQRMIIDARRANCHFRDPAYVSLATGDTLSRLEFNAGEVVTVGMADLKDAFYHLELPVALRRFFCLPSIQTRYLSEAGVVINGRQRMVTPRLRVVPMGWSHALYLCQRLHERLVLQSGLPSDLRLQDRRPVTGSECLHLQYVDNLVVLGNNQQQVEKSFHAAVTVLRSSGLQVHEVELGHDGAQILGWEVTSDAIMRPTNKRFWKVRYAIRGLLKRGRASARQLERLLGHCCFLSLARRESLSVFGQAYTFVRRYSGCADEKPLWPSIRREFDIWDGILPLIYCDLTAPWSENVLAVDASEWGLGCTSTKMSHEQVKELGGFCERWRFKDPTTSKARSFSQQQTVDTDMLTGEPSLIDECFASNERVTSNFSAVPFEAVDKRWQTVGRHRWKTSSTMPVNEARASLYALKHLLRSRGNHGRKHLILSDSMTAACAFSRGRAKTWELRRVCQQLGALCLATGTRACIRWVPSEWNPADSPSRGGWEPSVPVRCLSNGHSQIGAIDATATVEPSIMQTTCQQVLEDEVFPRPKTVSDQRYRFGDKSNAQGGSQESKGPGKSSSYKIESFSHNPSAGGSGDKGASKLSETLGVDSMVGDFRQGKDPGDKQGRQDSCRQIGGNVPGRGGPEFGTVSGCSSSLLQSTSQVACHDEAPLLQAELAGLAQIVPCSQSVAGSVGSYMSSHSARNVDRQDGNSRPYPHDVLHVPTSNRSTSCSATGLSETDPSGWTGVSTLERGAASLRSWNELKDTGVRRVLELGPRLPQECGGLSSKACPWMPSSRAPFEAHQCGCSDLPGRGIEKVEPGEVGEPACLPVPSRRCVSRHGIETKGPSRSSTPRPVEKSGIGPKIRERGTACSVDGVPSKKCPTTSPRSKQKNPHFTCRPALEVGRSLPEVVFLELFSGCGRLGKCFSRVCNRHVLLWDISMGSNYDLRKLHNRHKIMGWMRAGRVCGGHLGTPCNSFSRARDNPPGPPPLRSNECVLGLANLSPVDQQKVRDGNALMRFSVCILYLALALCLPWTMENPATSRLWICPSVLRLLRRKHVQLAMVEYCMFGMNWRKSTKLLGVWLDLSLLSSYRCVGSKRGLCRRTCRPHVPLQGVNEQGIWLTKLAEPYPQKLCVLLCKCFDNFYISQRAQLFESRL